jgi:hypothetical protein
MTDTPTPGQIAYAAYQRVHTEDGIRDGYVTLRPLSRACQRSHNVPGRLPRRPCGR